MGVNSYRGSSPSERRHPQKKSRVNSPEGRRMDYDNRYERRRSGDYSSDGDDDRRNLHCREDYSSDGDGYRRRLNRRGDYYSDGGRDRRMLSRREDYSSKGDVGKRRLSPRQSEFSPPASYPRRTEYDGRRRHGAPSYGGRHDPSYMISRESMDPRSAPFHGNPPNVHVQYDKYTDLEYGRHNARGIAPVDSRGHFSNYGEGSGYRERNRLNPKDTTLASGSVTKRYARHLDLTNHPVRRQG